MKKFTIIAGLAISAAVSGTAMAAGDHPWDAVDTGNCDVRNTAQPPYPGTNWTWTSESHRDRCVREAREAGNDELADKLEQHGVRAPRS